MRKRSAPRSYRVQSSGKAVFDLGSGPLVEKTFSTIDELFSVFNKLKRKHRSKTVKIAKVTFKQRLVPVK